LLRKSFDKKGGKNRNAMLNEKRPWQRGKVSTKVRMRIILTKTRELGMKMKRLAKAKPVRKVEATTRERKRRVDRQPNDLE